MRAWHCRALVLGLIAAAFGGAGRALPAAAEPEGFWPSLADTATVQVPGYDISWPQCGKPYPAGLAAYTIVGLNGGRPFTPNPCFLEQYRWAQHMERNPAIYVNTDFPKPGRDEPAKSGPYGACKEDDNWCRGYNYGWNLAKDVLERTAQHRVAPPMYWLDVETGNYWLDDTQANSQVIRGALDYFKTKNTPVGVYGTPRQWRIIAGSYIPAGPALPVWNAGAQGVQEAAARCTDRSFAFAGGVVKLVQYYDYGFDTNYACPGGHPLRLFPLADPFGRSGPTGRSLPMSGQPLPYWRVLPMVVTN